MFFDNRTSSKSSYFTSASYSEGLKSHFIKVYNYMAMALSISGATALISSKSSLLMGLIMNPLMILLFLFVPIGISFLMSSKIESLNLNQMILCLCIYSAAMGLMLAPIFLIYTKESIVRVFFISAGTFALSGLYGYTTKKDLTSIASFLFMGLIGLIIASIVNIFLKGSALEFILSIVGLGIFIVLAAFDTQKIKNQYLEMSNTGYSQEIIQKVGVMGALSLYLDFINIFIYMLRLFGNRRSD